MDVSFNRDLKWEVHMYELSSVFLEAEDWPEWFALDVLPWAGPAGASFLLLGIAKEPLHRLVAKLENAPILKDYTRACRDEGIEEDFFLDVEGPWGFGGILRPYQYAEVNDGF